MIPSIIHNPEMITLVNALLLNRYTSASETNTRNELYINASVCVSTNLHAEIKFLLDITSTAKTIVIAINAWKTSEYLLKKSTVR